MKIKDVIIVVFLALLILFGLGMLIYVIYIGINIFSIIKLIVGG